MRNLRNQLPRLLVYLLALICAGMSVFFYYFEQTMGMVSFALMTIVCLVLASDVQREHDEARPRKANKSSILKRKLEKESHREHIGAHNLIIYMCRYAKEKKFLPRNLNEAEDYFSGQLWTIIVDYKYHRNHRKYGFDGKVERTMKFGAEMYWDLCNS